MFIFGTCMYYAKYAVKGKSIFNKRCMYMYVTVMRPKYDLQHVRYPENNIENITFCLHDVNLMKLSLNLIVGALKCLSQ